MTRRAGDNPERLNSRASFAALTGVAPIPASSGQRSRFRLSRGGNRAVVKLLRQFRSGFLYAARGS
ncbi:transposase [Arthrobacter sp. AOP36-A1-22]|uniref:transposase n=1 Tax=Arthrobacter sp. AOP36-A1-22 TaxID=3457684 RepID=UPI004033CF98